MQPEVALMCIAVGLYIYDSAQWLYSNEALLIPVREKWIVRFGTDMMRLGGKELLIPNPLFPHRPLFKLAWHIQVVDASSSAQRWYVRFYKSD